jgi:hypothetical protein
VANGRDEFHESFAHRFDQSLVELGPPPFESGLGFQHDLAGQGAVLLESASFLQTMRFR